MKLLIFSVLIALNTCAYVPEPVKPTKPTPNKPTTPAPPVKKTLAEAIIGDWHRYKIYNGETQSFESYDLTACVKRTYRKDMSADLPDLYAYPYRSCEIGEGGRYLVTEKAVDGYKNEFGDEYYEVLHVVRYTENELVFLLDWMEQTGTESRIDTVYMQRIIK